MSEASEPMNEASGEEQGDSHPTVLTVNQLVAYNLMRARRSKGWTQLEAAAYLRAAGGRAWSPAALSAAERSWETGRPKEFDANELIVFARAYEQPLSYFFLPIPRVRGQYLYSLKKVHPRLEVTTVTDEVILDAAVPLRYPASFVQEVNNRLREQGLFWSPSSEIDWYRPEEQEDEHHDAEDADAPLYKEGEHGKTVTYTVTSEELARVTKKVVRDVEKELLKRFRGGGEIVISQDSPSEEEYPPF